MGSFLFCFSDAFAGAGEETVDEIMKGISSSFALPLRDLLKKEHPAEWKNMFSGFSGGFAFSYYPYPEQKQPWDPDFTYGFGYFDWHPGTISVQYNNYSGNRYPWHKKSPDTGRFKDGAITISWSWMW